jgi:hypothetical protein
VLIKYNVKNHALPMDSDSSLTVWEDAEACQVKDNAAVASHREFLETGGNSKENIIITGL